MQLQKSRMRSHADYWIYLLALACIFGSFYFRPISLIGLLIGTVYIAKHDTMSSMCLLFFLLPFAQVFKISPSSTSLFTILELTLVMKTLINNYVVSKKYFVLTFGYTGYVLIGSIISGNIDILGIVKLLMNLSLLYMFIDQYTPSCLDSIVSSFSIGLLASSVVGFFKTAIPGLLVLFKDLNSQYINGMRVTRFSATFSDPNYYSIAVIVALGLLICATANSGFKVKYVVFSILIGSVGFFTYSKSYLLMLVLLIFVAFLLLIGNKKIGLTTVAIIGVAVILASGVLSRIQVIQSLLSRFSSASTVNSLTTGRSDIWASYMMYINSNNRVFLFGDGLGAPYIIGAAHNMYVETWYHVGIVGLILYLLVLFGILNHRQIITRKRFINYYLLVAVFTMYAFLNGLTAFEFAFYMMSCWIVNNSVLVGDKKHNEL